jgi:hypothetical protein
MTVFIASMALTLGSLFAFVGPRHCGHGMYRHGHHSGWHVGNCERQAAYGADS